MAEDRVLYCNCSYAKVVPEETKQAVLDTLRGWATERFGDLDAPRRSTERYELQVLQLS